MRGSLEIVLFFSRSTCDACFLWDFFMECFERSGAACQEVQRRAHPESSAVFFVELGLTHQFVSNIRPARTCDLMPDLVLVLCL